MSHNWQTANACNAMTEVKELSYFNGPLSVLKQLDGVFYLWHLHDRTEDIPCRDTWLIVRVSPEVAEHVQTDMPYRDALLSDPEGWGLFAQEIEAGSVGNIISVWLPTLGDDVLPEVGILLNGGNTP